MTYHIEVCIDNLESLHNAIEGGATRIELCSSLALGGLTPSFGFMKKAAEIATTPVNSTYQHGLVLSINLVRASKMQSSN